MTDQIIRLGGSVLQHGALNDRVYLMKLSGADFPDVMDRIDTLARRNRYSKIFAKVPGWARERLEAVGYETEAYIPRFFEGREDAYFMSRYLSEARKAQKDRKTAEQVLQHARETRPVDGPRSLPDRCSFDVLTPKDAEELAAVYRTVFETYPFPVFDPDYLKETMDQNLVYFGIREQGRLAAVSSCEMDESSRNVEMTDFATLPEYRATGLASFLLGHMEREMIQRGILTAYTIARSLSYGMNTTFAKHAYRFGGTLINNTNISGAIESMNVWYKPLPPAGTEGDISST